MAGSDFVTDIYVESGYVDNTFVEGNYVNTGYVTGIVAGSASLTSSATITATPSRTRQGATNITGFASVLNASLRIREASASISTTASLSATLIGNTIEGTIDASALGQTTLTGNLTLRPQAGITAQATLFGDAFRTRNTSADLVTNMGDTAWEDMGTWNNPTQTYWESFLVSADVTQTASCRVDSTFTISCNAVRTRPGALDVSAQAQVSASLSGNTNKSTASLSTTATITVDAVRSRDGTVLKVSLGELSVDGVRTRNVSSTISSAMVFELDAFRTRNAASLQASLGSLSATATRARFAGADLESNVTLEANSVVPGQADLSTSATLIGSFGRIRANTEILTSSEFTLEGTLGGIIGARTSMTGFASTLSALTIYTIDPYRVLAVKSEGRTLIIEAESRKKSINAENRVNTIHEETRVKQIKSETRKLEVQSLRLEETTGNPLDVRK